MARLQHFQLTRLGGPHGETPLSKKLWINKCLIIIYLFYIIYLFFMIRLERWINCKDSPFKLKIVAIIRGRMWEMFFHIRYEEYRIHHEWFTFVPEMLQLTDFLKTKGYGRIFTN